MKKILTICLLGVLVLSGCQNSTDVTTNQQEDDSLLIVCTIYPICDWIEVIAEDKVTIDYLLDNGIDLHQYQPSAQDIIQISISDLVVYVGGDSDTWASSVIAEDINALSLISYVSEDVLIEYEEDHDHEDESDEEDHDHEDEADEEDHGHEHTTDEHIWLSLKLAKQMVVLIGEEIIALDPENEDFYRNNMENYISELDALDQEYADMISTSKNDIIVVTDQFPLNYFVNDYGLNYVAAFEGCSADSEVTFETMKLLVDTAADENIHYIITMENSQYGIADSILSMQPDLIELSFDSMQSRVAGSDEGSYLKTMKENLEVLRIALN